MNAFCEAEYVIEAFFLHETQDQLDLFQETAML